MMGETASIFAQSMIETLLHVHALSNMHRASGNEEYRKTAADWLPSLESQFRSLKEELTRAKGAHHG
jgi:hypothetical protein